MCKLPILRLMIYHDYSGIYPNWIRLINRNPTTRKAIEGVIDFKNWIFLDYINDYSTIFDQSSRLIQGSNPIMQYQWLCLGIPEYCIMGYALAGLLLLIVDVDPTSAKYATADALNELISNESCAGYYYPQEPGMSSAYN